MLSEADSVWNIALMLSETVMSPSTVRFESSVASPETSRVPLRSMLLSRFMV